MPVVCPNCFKIFRSSVKLKKHLENQCKIDLDQELNCLTLQTLEKNNIICKHCGLSFERDGHLKKHLQSMTTKCFIMQLASQQKTINITNIDNKQITNNIDKQINITPSIGFVKTGSENIDHITKDVLLRILNINHFPRVCVEFMKELYFNKKVPENHNWFIAYPNHEKAGVVYNYEIEEFVRTSTEDIINEKFDNMMHLLQPLIEEIYKEDEQTNNLNNVQRLNLQRFYGIFGAYHLAKESEEIYNAIHQLAFDFQKIPKTSWKEQGLDGNHLSIKF